MKKEYQHPFPKLLPGSPPHQASSHTRLAAPLEPASPICPPTSSEQPDTWEQAKAIRPKADDFE